MHTDTDAINFYYPAQQAVVEANVDHDKRLFKSMVASDKNTVGKHLM